MANSNSKIVTTVGDYLIDDDNIGNVRVYGPVATTSVPGSPATILLGEFRYANSTPSANDSFHGSILESAFNFAYQRAMTETMFYVGVGHIRSQMNLDTVIFGDISTNVAMIRDNTAMLRSNVATLTTLGADVNKGIYFARPSWENQVALDNQALVRMALEENNLVDPYLYYKAQVTAGEPLANTPYDYTPND